MEKQESHLFAIYIENLSQLQKGKELEIVDKALHQRLSRILRLKSGEQVTFFDKNINIQAVFLDETYASKKSIFVKVLNSKKNKALFPEIVFCPSILKKSSFEHVIYIAAQMGANSILPIMAEKSVKSFWSQKEKERLDKIIISACEQAKNFNLPELRDPIKLQDFIKNCGTKKAGKIFFDPEGGSLFDLLKKVNEKKVEKLFLLIGPEGGFTDSEMKLLEKSEFKSYCFTPTILRSIEASALALGSIRSVTR